MERCYLAKRLLLWTSCLLTVLNITTRFLKAVPTYMRNENFGIQPFLDEHETAA